MFCVVTGSVTYEAGYGHRDIETMMGFSNWYEIELCLEGEEVLSLDGEQSLEIERRMEDKTL